MRFVKFLQICRRKASFTAGLRLHCLTPPPPGDALTFAPKRSAASRLGPAPIDCATPVGAGLPWTVPLAMRAGFEDPPPPKSPVRARVQPPPGLTHMVLQALRRVPARGADHARTLWGRRFLSGLRRYGRLLHPVSAHGVHANQGESRRSRCPESSSGAFPQGGDHSRRLRKRRGTGCHPEGVRAP
jgi:hypothetical protein